MDALDGSIFDEASNFTYNTKGEVISDSDKTGKSKGSKGFSTFNNTNGSQGARMLKNGRSVGDISSSGLTPMQQIMKLKGELKKKGGVTAKRRKEINDKIDEIKKQMGANLSSNVATHKAAIAASTGRATTKKYNERVNKNLTKDSLEELKKASEAESRRLRGEEEPMSREDALKEIEKEKASANNDVKEQEDKIKETVQKAQQSNDPGFISKVVASLRNFYRKFLEKANQEHDSGKIAWYRNFARVILNYIDKLLAKLDKTQNS